MKRTVFLALALVASTTSAPAVIDVGATIQQWNRVYYRCLTERTQACYDERDRLFDVLTSAGYCSQREPVLHPGRRYPSRDWVWRHCGTP